MSIERTVLNDRRSNRIARMVVAGTLALAAFVVGRMTAPEGSSDSPVGPARTVSPEVNDPGSSGTSSSFARTRQGAVAAATHSAHVMSSATGDLAAFVDATAAIAAPSWKDDARRLAENTVKFVAERYGPNGSTAFVPVRYRLSAFGGDSAIVNVWGVTLADAGNGQAIDESWVTGTIELVWIDGQWLVTGGNSEVGPTPELLQTEDPVVTSSLAGFKDYSSVPQP